MQTWMQEWCIFHECCENEVKAICRLPQALAWNHIVVIFRHILDLERSNAKCQAVFWKLPQSMFIPLPIPSLILY